MIKKVNGILAVGLLINALRFFLSLPEAIACFSTGFGCSLVVVGFLRQAWLDRTNV